MAIGWQKGTLFAGGLLLGVGLGAWAVVGPLHAVHGPVPVPPPQADAAAVPVADLKVPAGSLRCDFTPIAPKAGADDGQKSLQPHPTGATADEVSAQLLAGKEAAASGHHRDAEVAFLNACHSAQVVPRHDDVLVADADYQLARLYGNLAMAGGPRAGELRQRAQELYGATLATYRARYGEDGEKTRFAAHGLAMLETKFGQAGAAQSAAVPAGADKPEVKSASAMTQDSQSAAKPRAAADRHVASSTADSHAASRTPDIRAASRTPESQAASPAPEREPGTTAVAKPRANAAATLAMPQPTASPRETTAAIPLAQHTAFVPKPRETMAAVPLAQRTQRGNPEPPSANDANTDRSNDASTLPARPPRHAHRDDTTATTSSSDIASPTAPVGTASGDAHAAGDADDAQ